MILNSEQKKELTDRLVSCLASDDEIRRIVVFGSFVHSVDPQDMDVAIFQNSESSYLSLAMKYRRQARAVSAQIPLDIIPLRNDITNIPFMAEIERGETIYER